MGKGKQAATQTQIQDVPAWAKPYYTDLIGKSKALSEEAYTPYGGQRVAGEAGDLGTAQGIIRGIAGQPVPGMAEAQGTLGGLGSLAGQLGQQAPAQFSATGVNQYQYDPARQFDTDEAMRYMDPFMQTVVGRQQEDAIEQFRRQQASRAAGAVSAGAFGGSRQAVQEGIAEETLARQLGDIQATGSQRAFEQAQQQFERDRAAGMTTEQRRAEELGRVQGIDVSEQARVQGATADEAMRQREFQLQTMGFSADMAREVANLGERARQGDIQAAQLLEAQGLGEMARAQARLDVGYEDFLRQQQFPQQQLSQYSAILRGLPVGDAGTTTTMQPYNPMQQALGAGISALGLYKGLQ
jgi:hypothetical protein